jgi:Holliday junction DNA helicase RuvA
MIGKLKGVVDTLLEDTVIMDVQGVGYEVSCPVRVLQALNKGEAAELWIETVVREDQFKLIGFLSEAERRWFRLLMTVQGVGAKVALALLGILKPGDLSTAIALGDKAAISQAPGVGKRVAERIVTELRDKAGAMTSLESSVSPEIMSAQETGSGAAQEAVSALVNLGYGRPQAHMAVAHAAKEAGEDASVEVLIRQGLRALATL